MKNTFRNLSVSVAMGVLVPLGVLAANLTIPTVFTPGTAIKASEMNANFAAVQAAVNSKADATSASAGPRIVDANATTVGPLFSVGTTYGSFGYSDATGNLWTLDMETGALNPMQDLGNTWLLFTQTNCAGTGYIQLGQNGGSSRPALFNGVFRRDTEFRARRGPLVQALPGTLLSYRDFASGACSNMVSNISFNAGYGPYILSTNTAIVTKPTNTWVLPLRLAF